MKRLIAVICFMLAASPFAMAQDKKDSGAKPPVAVEKTEKKSGDKKATEKKKREPSEKQKAQQEKMKACSKDASDKKLKGDQRKSFMKDCMKK